MRMLTRYVLVELAKVFLIALTGLTLLFLVLVLVKEAADHSLPLTHVLRLIPYALPESLTMTIPVTLLLACTTVYSRMSGANEVVAAKALGISPMALLQPAFCLALLLSLATVWLDDLAVSWGRNGMQGVVVEGAVDIIYSLLRAKHSYTSPIFSINVRGVQGQRLLRPTVVMQGRGNYADDDHRRRRGRTRVEQGGRRFEDFPPHGHDRRGRKNENAVPRPL